MQAQSIQIERGIPLPQGVQAVQTMKRMEVGDSIFVPGRNASRMQDFIKQARAGTEKMFTARTTTGGARVWRTE